MNLATRVARTLKVVRTSAYVWGLYKLPAFWRRVTRQPARTEKELSPTHARAADAVLALALDLRGVMIKMCQAIATRSDMFPKEIIDRLKQCHDY